MPSQDPFDILACPACKSPLERRKEPSSLICRQCGLIFTIRDGIPVTLVDEAHRVA